MAHSVISTCFRVGRIEPIRIELPKKPNFFNGGSLIRVWPVAPLMSHEAPQRKQSASHQGGSTRLTRTDRDTLCHPAPTM